MKIEHPELLIRVLEAYGIEVAKIGGKAKTMAFDNNILFELYKDHPELVADILRSEEVTGIDLNLTDFEDTLLISYIKSNEEELVEALINRKKLEIKNNNINENHYGEQEEEDITLISNFINKPNNQGVTPLMAASLTGNLIIINLLKLYNLNWKAKDYNDENAMFYAIRGKSLETLNEFLKYKEIDLNARNIEDKTCLMVACENNQFHMVETLFPLSNSLLQDNKKEDALTISLKNGYFEIGEFLIDNLQIEKIENKAQYFKSLQQAAFEYLNLSKNLEIFKYIAQALIYKMFTLDIDLKSYYEDIISSFTKNNLENAQLNSKDIFLEIENFLLILQTPALKHSSQNCYFLSALNEGKEDLYLPSFFSKVNPYLKSAGEAVGPLTTELTNRANQFATQVSSLSEKIFEGFKTLPSTVRNQSPSEIDIPSVPTLVVNSKEENSVIEGLGESSEWE